ncbi:MAG: enoyl-CoA hydratase/isomerase family protein [Pseudomonadales bacterium]|nr:enoyl-CoA hydratase/isomerase family protein [Pseudomonadales bacterium]
MSNLTLEQVGQVYVLGLNDLNTDNTYTNDVLNEYFAYLDEVEASRGNASLVITSSHPKTWCNGINLNWFMGQTADEQIKLIKNMERLYLRLATLNLPTVGCITGNVYAGGAIMACALDFRYMRSDRGRFCFSEVDVKLPFSPIMTEIIKLLPNRQALSELALTGVRWGAEECLPKQVVDGIFPESTLYEKCMEKAEFLATKDRSTYTTIKHRLRPEVVALKNHPA